MLLDDFLLTYLVFMSTHDLCQALLGQYPFPMHTNQHTLNRKVSSRFLHCWLAPWLQSLMAAPAAEAKKRAKTPSLGSARYCSWSPTGVGFIRTSWKKRSTFGVLWRYVIKGLHDYVLYLYIYMIYIYMIPYDVFLTHHLEIQVFFISFLNFFS